MIVVTYQKDEAGLWSFIIEQDGQVRSHTPQQFPTLKAAKKLFNECVKPIRKGNGIPEPIKKIIIK